MEQLSYWGQLHVLYMYYPERRREMYLIIYKWRVMEGQSPNISEPNKGGIDEKWHIRRVVKFATSRKQMFVQILW